MNYSGNMMTTNLHSMETKKRMTTVSTEHIGHAATNYLLLIYQNKMTGVNIGITRHPAAINLLAVEDKNS
jgi:hypothetical protein